MALHISPPTANDTRSSLADWLELQCVLSERHIVTTATLANVLDIAGDDTDARTERDDQTGEVLDGAILESSRNAIIEALLDELEHRVNVMGNSYPYSINARRQEIRLAVNDPIDNPSHAVYLFCLFASAIREKKLQPESDIRPLASLIPRGLQICACLAAAGYVVGEVSSFGFPREEGDAFLAALNSTYRRFGAGTIRTDVPAGWSESQKDGGIDVIAWRNHPDGMAGKTYLLGQTASGIGWKEKSILEYVGQFHRWFTTPPASFYLPAMFIPFTLHSELVDSGEVAYFEARRGRFEFHEPRFGIIFDRFRITHFAGRGMMPPNDGVDGIDQFQSVVDWVADTIAATTTARTA